MAKLLSFQAQKYDIWNLKWINTPSFANSSLPSSTTDSSSTTGISISQSLVSAGLDHNLSMWQFQKIEKPISIAQYSDFTLGIPCCAINSDHSLLATSCIDNKLRVYNVNENKLVSTHQLPPAKCWSVDFSPKDPNLCVIAGSDFSITFFNCLSKQATIFSVFQGLVKPSESEEKHQQKDFIMVCKFTPDAKHLAIATGDGNLRIVDISTKNIIIHKKTISHQKPIRAISFDPTGTYCFVCSDDGLSYVLSVPQYSLVKTLSSNIHKGPMKAISCSPKMFEIANFEKISNQSRNIKGQNQTSSVLPTPKYSKVAMGCASGRITVWNINQKTPLNQFTVKSSIHTLDFDSTGTLLACGCSDGQVFIFHV